MVVHPDQSTHIPNTYRGSSKKMQSQPCFFTKSVEFGRAELSFFSPDSSSRDLQSGHGFRACSLKNKRNKLDLHTCGRQKREKNSLTKSVRFWSPELEMIPKRSARQARIFSQMLGLKNLEDLAK